MFSSKSPRYTELYKFISYFNTIDRTKVECAGLCLSIKGCHAFRWIPSSSGTKENICRILENNELCITVNLSPIDIYVDASIDIPSCEGELIHNYHA